MQITFRRYDNTISSMEPVEQATLFDFGNNTQLAETQFEAIKQMMRAQQALYLVTIFDMDNTHIHFTRSIAATGTMPNEDCYLNCL